MTKRKDGWTKIEEGRYEHPDHGAVVEFPVTRYAPGNVRGWYAYKVEIITPFVVGVYKTMREAMQALEK